jgi:hypothetical protein
MPGKPAGLSVLHCQSLMYTPRRIRAPGGLIVFSFTGPRKAAGDSSAEPRPAGNGKPTLFYLKPPV